MRTPLIVVLTLSLSLLLVACGGDDGDADPTGPVATDSAQATSGAASGATSSQAPSASPAPPSMEPSRPATGSNPPSAEPSRPATDSNPPSAEPSQPATDPNPPSSSPSLPEASLEGTPANVISTPLSDGLRHPLGMPLLLEPRRTITFAESFDSVDNLLWPDDAYTWIVDATGIATIAPTFEDPADSRPHVTFHETGTYVIGLVAREPGGEERVFQDQRVVVIEDRSGDTFETGLDIGHNHGTFGWVSDRPDRILPRSFTNADGRTLVVWNQRTSSGTPGIIARSIDGTTVGEAVELTEVTGATVGVRRSTATHFNLDLAAVPDGRAAMVWNEISAGDGRRIAAAFFDPVTDAFHDVGPIPGASSGAKFPQVAVWLDGDTMHALAIWYVTFSSAGNVRWSHWNGTAWSEAADLSDRNDQTRYPQLVATVDGSEIHAFWPIQELVDGDFVYRTRTAAFDPQTGWGPIGELALDPEVHDPQRELRVTAAAAGSHVTALVWSHGRPGSGAGETDTSPIWAFDRVGSAWSAPVLVGGPGGSIEFMDNTFPVGGDEHDYVLLGLNAAGHALAVWEVYEQALAYSHRMPGSSAWSTPAMASKFPEYPVWSNPFGFYNGSADLLVGDNVAVLTFPVGQRNPLHDQRLHHTFYDLAAGEWSTPSATGVLDGEQGNNTLSLLPGGTVRVITELRRLHSGHIDALFAVDVPLP